MSGFTTQSQAMIWRPGMRSVAPSKLEPSDLSTRKPESAAASDDVVASCAMLASSVDHAAEMVRLRTATKATTRIGNVPGFAVALPFESFPAGKPPIDQLGSCASDASYHGRTTPTRMKSKLALTFFVSVDTALCTSDTPSCCAAATSAAELSGCDSAVRKRELLPAVSALSTRTVGVFAAFSLGVNVTAFASPLCGPIGMLIVPLSPILMPMFGGMMPPNSPPKKPPPCG